MITSYAISSCHIVVAFQRLEEVEIEGLQFVGAVWWECYHVPEHTSLHPGFYDYDALQR